MYTENFTTKKKKKKKEEDIYIYSYFCSKHRLWVLIRTASTSDSNEYPQSMFFSRNKKNNVYPCKPQFYYKKVGFKGSKLYRHVFVMRFGLHQSWMQDFGNGGSIIIGLG